MLILLDIDGVMVVANSWKRPEFLKDGFPAFSQKSTIALQKLLSETKADILLTTSHKAKYTIQEWKKIFEIREIKINDLFCLPENISFLSRKEEIMNWVNFSKNSSDFIIIDDDKTLNSLPLNIKEKLLQTDSMIGLTIELVNEKLANLKKNNSIVI